MSGKEPVRTIMGLIGDTAAVDIDLINALDIVRNRKSFRALTRM